MGIAVANLRLVTVGVPLLLVDGLAQVLTVGANR